MENATYTEPQFWNCISILLNNYHAANRKIFACVLCDIQQISKGIACLHEELQPATESAAIKSCVCTEQVLQETFKALNKQEAANCEGFVLKFKFLTKKLEQENIAATSIIDFTSKAYICRFHCNNIDDFSIKFRDKQIIVDILTQRLDVEVSTRWAEYVLKPKLLKWSQSCNNDDKPHKTSLALVDKENYNNLYKELKSKYAERAVKFWNDAKESTDPIKFIYEDLAITAYLITLWQQTNTIPTAFADLGCGNGLLVFILNEEGYKGYGYDVRARKIWNHYPTTTRIQLIEQAIEPNSFKLSQEIDWLIGNHSDELSPWLPVLAATTSFQMRYFLLPCCAFELSGAKFQRRNTSISGYQDFFNYASAISQKCGYITLQDRLKIPSTKRLALIGLERTHAESEFECHRSALKKYVVEERNKYANAIAQDEVKLREKYESVRNCTQIDKRIIAHLVEKIFKMLLESDNVACVSDKPESDRSWRTGGHLSMREIVQQLTRADLLHIKSECGGIKTLLRNNREVFEFCCTKGSGEWIQLRKPKLRSLMESDNKSQTIKKRQCYFKQHHPNGCPLTDEECTFIH